MKPGTITQMYVQVVFAVKYRDAVLKKDIRKHVYEYISGIITNLKPTGYSSFINFDDLSSVFLRVMSHRLSSKS